MICCFFWFGVGAVQLCTPLLLPRNRQIYEHNEAALFMDHSGMLVMLPFDLRVRLGPLCQQADTMSGHWVDPCVKGLPLPIIPTPNPRPKFEILPLGNVFLRMLSVWGHYWNFINTWPYVHPPCQQCECCDPRTWSPALQVPHLNLSAELCWMTTAG